MTQSNSDSDDLTKKIRRGLRQWIFSPLAGVLFSEWLAMLKKHAGSIPPSYWPRTMFTTGMAAMNSLISLHESRKFGGKFEHIEVKRPVFIVGHHRSGTTFLWNLIATDPRFIYPKVTQTLFPQTFLSFRSLAKKLAQKFGPDERPQDNVEQSVDAPMGEEWGLCASTFLSTHMARHFPAARQHFKKYLTMRDAGEEEKTTWKEAFHRFSQKLLYDDGNDNSILLYKAPTHTAKIKLILEQFPDARFIHIHRNPYRVYQSTMKMERKALPLCAYQPGGLDDLEEYVLWRYKTMYDAFFEDVDLIPDGQFTQISYRQLEEKPAETVKEIYTAVGLPDFEEARPGLNRYIASLVDYQKNSYPPLPRQTREQIARAWGSHFQRLGYPLETSGTPESNGQSAGKKHRPDQRQTIS